MRYALSETEWTIIRPTRSRGVPRVDDLLSDCRRFVSTRDT